MGKFMVVSVEPGVVRGVRQQRAGLRRGDDQLPWLDRVRSDIYRLDQRRLGRQTIRRSNEGTRLRGEDVSVHRQESRGGARRELRWLDGQLVVGAYRPI